MQQLVETTHGRFCRTSIVMHSDLNHFSGHLKFMRLDLAPTCYQVEYYFFFLYTRTVDYQKHTTVHYTKLKAYLEFIMFKLAEDPKRMEKNEYHLRIKVLHSRGLISVFRRSVLQSLLNTTLIDNQSID